MSGAPDADAGMDSDEEDDTADLSDGVTATSRACDSVVMPRVRRAVGELEALYAAEAAEARETLEHARAAIAEAQRKVPGHSRACAMTFVCVCVCVAQLSRLEDDLATLDVPRALAPDALAVPLIQDVTRMLREAISGGGGGGEEEEEEKEEKDDGSHSGQAHNQ